MVKNLPFNAGDLDLIPGYRTRIPHAGGQLISLAATREVFVPQLSLHAVEPILQNKRSLCTTRRERLHATRRPHTAVRTQCRQQFKKKKKKITVRIVSQVSLKDCLLCYNSQVDMNKIFHLFLKHTYTHYS